nr:transcriptional regulator [Nocardioides sp. zg-1230]
MLALHAVRLLGFADTARVAARYRLDRDGVGSHLEDLRARGWVTRSEFAGTSGWSLTDRGRCEDERLLATELDATGARDAVAEAHTLFLPLNGRLLDAVTRWQLRPVGANAFAANDHSDFRWDDRVLASLAAIGRRLGHLEAELVGALPRFAGYVSRYDAALARSVGGQHRWVDGVGIDSCHVVWMQLHEDLIATLGLERRAGG